MKKRLNSLNGTVMKNLPFELTWIADLLSYEWPMISIYSDAQCKPYLYAWIDGSEKVDRYLISNIGERTLEGYLLKVTPYDELFENALDDRYFAIDINKLTGDISTIVELTYKQLQPNHKPEKGLYLDFEDQSDVDKIAHEFNFLMNREKFIFGAKSILEDAKSAQKDIVNIHLNSTNGKVGHGSVQSHILGQVLVEYNKMAEASVLKIYQDRGMRKDSHVWKDGERDSVISMAHTEYYAEAASFNVKLTPVKTRTLKDGTAMEQIAEKIFLLMSIGEDFSSESISMETFPQEMLNAYDNFLSIINRHSISIALQYGNPNKNSIKQEYFDSFKSSRIVKQLRRISEGKPHEVRFTGKFRSFHLDKRSFEFRTLSGNEISGHVKPDVADAISYDVFKPTFDIVVERVYQQKKGRLGMSTKNTIVSCIKSVI
jgi:hypothetical protein